MPAERDVEEVQVGPPPVVRDDEGRPRLSRLPERVVRVSREAGHGRDASAPRGAVGIEPAPDDAGCDSFKDVFRKYPSAFPSACDGKEALQ